MNKASEIRDFIVSNFFFGDAGALEDDTSFLESGTVDSSGMLEVIMFLEEKYRIKVEPEEMLPENLDSVNKVAQFLATKLAKSSA